MKHLLDGPPLDLTVDGIATCSGCGCALPPHAVYCIACGRCELSQTDDGTRIVRSPYAPNPPASDPSPTTVPPPPEFGSGPFPTADPPEVPYAEDQATIPVAPLDTNPDLALRPEDFEDRRTAAHQPVDTRAVTRAVDTDAQPPRRRGAPLPVPPKRSRRAGGYLIAPTAARTVDAVAGTLESPEPDVRTLSRPAPRWAPTGITRLDTERREDTAVTRAPAAPSPYWDAPPKGNTVKRRPPTS